MGSGLSRKPLSRQYRRALIYRRRSSVFARNRGLAVFFPFKNSPKKKTKLQFLLPRGSNFEGSTSYHRLSADLCHYATAIALRRGFTFPEDHFHRLAAMSRFMHDVTKPDGCIAQIGDNDNGRFFKFFPAYDHSEAWAENHLYAELTESEKTLVRRLAGTSFPSEKMGRSSQNQSPAQTWEALKKSLSAPALYHAKPLVHHAPFSTFSIKAYPAFGVYVFRADSFFLAVRCGPIGQNGIGGHAHNDQLSVELQIEGKDIYRDPGSYLYTPLPDVRNRYRSVKAHDAPQGNREPGRLDLGLFILGDDAKAECLYWGEKGFIGRHRGFGSWVYRQIELSSGTIEISDFYEDARVAQEAAPRDAAPFSPGYGLQNL